MASATLSASAASPWTMSTWSCHGRSARFRGRRAITRTAKPAASSSGTRRPPMYPVGPVTRASWRVGAVGSVITGPSCQSEHVSQSVQGRSHATLSLVAQSGEGRFHERCYELDDALEPEVRRIGHLGLGERRVAAHLTKGHGVLGDDRLVLAPKGSTPVRDQILDHIGQLGLAAGEGGGVLVLGSDGSVAGSPDGLDRSRVPFGGGGEV